MFRFGAPVVVQGIDDMTVRDLQGTFLYAMKELLYEDAFREVIKSDNYCFKLITEKDFTASSSSAGLTIARQDDAFRMLLKLRFLFLFPYHLLPSEVNLKHKLEILP
jgi:hypothetical protein